MGDRTARESAAREPAAAEPLAFARRLAGDLAGISPGWLAGCYLHGSAALGGWNARRSDVDVLVVAAAWSADLHQQVGGTLGRAARDCPGRGLELSVVSAEAAAAPGPPWPFLLHTAPGDGDLRLVDGTTHPGDPDLVLHYAVTHAHGLAVHGPPPRDAIGEVAPDDVLAQLAAELDWALDHADEGYVVLNALRAQAYAATGEWLSKTAAGERAVERAGDQPIVSWALAVQRGDEDPRAPGDEARALVRRARAAIPWHPARPPREHEA